MSIGVAVMKPGDTAADVMLRADRSLYQAKADGKNLVRVYPSVPPRRQGTPLEPNGKEPAR